MKREKLNAELKKQLTTKESAEFLGVDRKTIQRYRKAGILTPQTFGKNNAVLYMKEQLIQAATSLLADPQKEGSSGDKLSKFRPEVATSYKKIIKRYTWKENVQVNPTRTLLVPNDRLSKKLFNLSDENFQDACRGTISLVEVKNHKKFGKIVSPFKIIVDEHAEFTLSEPLDQFDCDVLIVCISEYRAGNRHLTPAIIYRGLTGKIGRGDAEPSKDQLAAIMHSLKKLMSLQIEIVMTDICIKFNYEDNTSTIITANLLPCEIITETTINGKESTVIHLLDESPIWKVASIKNNQILSFDADLLDIPRQQNTPLNIMVKFYVIRRVLESLAHRQMALTVTFADVFQKCRLENADRVIQLRIRKFMIAIFEHLKDKGIIGDYKVNKKGRTFYSISFFKK